MNILSQETTEGDRRQEDAERETNRMEADHDSYCDRVHEVDN